MFKSFIAFVTALFAPVFSASAAGPDFDKQRARLVETLRKDAIDFVPQIGKSGLSVRVLEALGKVERHLFIPKRFQSMAYANHAVSIGKGQTISQPFIVALMTHLAQTKPDHKVLEIGTGSGYQAAILSLLVRKVCSIEIIKSLADEAAQRLAKLGYKNVSVRAGDGYKGWKECGPFDSVVVTAALDHVPDPLIDQLKVGGRIVMPVGESRGVQELQVIEKTGPDQTRTKKIIPVVFVPFTRGQSK